MNIHYFIHFSLFFALSFAQNETEIQRMEKEESYRRAYHGLVVGYDCSTPTEVTSHELDTIEDCEEKMIQESSTPAQVQILQRSNKYVIKATSCSLRRTRKLSHCGSHDHSVSCYSEEYTYRKIEVSEKQCKNGSTRDNWPPQTNK